MSPRLFLHVMGLEARKRLTYRADFWITAVVTVVVEFALAWFLWRAIFSPTGGEVAGWSLGAMVAYYATAILAGRLVRGPEFEGVVSQDIYEGALSRYLVYPAPYFGFKYAQAVGSVFPVVVQTAVFTTAALLLFDLPSDVRVTPASAAMGIVAIAAAHFVHHLVLFPIQSVAFWADNVWSLTVAHRLVSTLLGGAMLPLSVFPAWTQGVLHALPFRLYYAWPVEVILGRAGVAAWLEGLAWAAGWSAVLAAFSWGVWRRGRLRYTGVGM